MPELPGIITYCDALTERVVGHRLIDVGLRTPFLQRSVDPALQAVHGRAAAGVSRLAKRIVIALEGDFYLVIHLMIAGRLHWKPANPKIGSKLTRASFEFDHGAWCLPGPAPSGEPRSTWWGPEPGSESSIGAGST